MLKIMVRDRDKIYFKGDAASLTSFNDAGEFDILQGHANFITLLKKKIVIDKNLKSQNEIEVDRGVLSVSADEVAVYLGF